MATIPNETKRQAQELAQKQFRLRQLKQPFSRDVTAQVVGNQRLDNPSARHPSARRAIADMEAQAAQEAQAMQAAGELAPLLGLQGGGMAPEEAMMAQAPPPSRYDELIQGYREMSAEIEQETAMIKQDANMLRAINNRRRMRDEIEEQAEFEDRMMRRMVGPHSDIYVEPEADDSDYVMEALFGR